jgi:hypothetical protein
MVAACLFFIFILLSPSFDTVSLTPLPSYIQPSTSFYHRLLPTFLSYTTPFAPSTEPYLISHGKFYGNSF